ncbi:MAG: bacteriocin system transporter, ATP-binding protein [Candidatus Angelobacter sp.]|nr:bacteriocin system transporter, ATP-binding protein [Candidatus Angelobacter sp.]
MCVWVVQAGKLDLFLTRVENGEAVGARHHVLRVDESHAVFGVGPCPAGMAMMASALPGTQLLSLSLSELHESDQQSRGIHLLEDWISNLGSAVSKNVLDQAFIALEAGRTVSVTQEPKPIVPKEGVLWVEHRKGKSRFLAMENVASVNGSGFFPVSRHGWLETTPGSELYSMDSSSILKIDRELEGLRAFHAVVLSCLVAEREKTLQSHEKRVQERAIRDATSLHSALLRLGAPIQKIRAMADPEDSCSDPTFLACQLMGKTLGIKIKPHPDMLRGITPLDPVSAIAKASGVRIRQVALRGDWWKQDYGPLLAFRQKDNHPVTLVPRSDHHNEICDPQEHSVVPLTGEAASALKPIAYMMYRPFPLKQLTLFDLIKFGAKGSRRELLTIVATGLGAGFMGIMVPYATGIIFDQLIPGAAKSQLVQMSVFLLTIAVSTAMLTFVRSLTVLRFQGKLDAALQAAVWDRILGLPVSFFRDYGSGDLAQRSMGISQMREMLTGPTLSAILSGIFSLASFILLFYYSWQLALVATVLVIIACMVTLACGIVQVRCQRDVFMLQGRISSKLLQFITGLPKFRVSATEVRAFASWARDFSQQKEKATMARRAANRLALFISVYPIVCLATIFYFHGAVLSAAGPNQLTTGSFLAFLALFIQFLTGALALSSALIEALRIIPVYERAKPILHALPEVTETRVHPGELTGRIEVSHAVFRYKPGTPPVLRDLSVRIEPGQFVAFVGPSGSGKSTLLRLLLGFETPELGAVYYDGKDLAGLDVQAVRQQIGVVMQSSRPISGTIFTNIIGATSLTLDAAWEAARLAGIEEDIRKMPMGMHTYLTDGGGGISGGQRQRLMIARAIVGRPRILLFDEATSALDNRTQAIVSRSLESLRTTRIVIAHRLSTIVNADRIFVIDKGVVVQSGAYQQLLEQEGIFQQLAKRQLT